MFCGGCGKGLAADERFCSQCGGQANTSQQRFQSHNTVGVNANDITMMHGQQNHQPRNGMAVAGFVCALIGIFIFPLEIIGLVFSILGLVRANKMGGIGRGMAIAGIVLGAIGIGTLIWSIVQNGGLFIW